MSQKKNIIAEKGKIVDFSRIEKFHPYKTFLFFALIGSTVLFMSFTFLYFLTISRTATPVELSLPKSFSVSTVLLMVSSFTVSRITRAYKEDSAFELKAFLLSTIALGTGFVVSQFIGWKYIYDQGFFMGGNVGVSYLYLITGIHFLHAIGGLIYMSVITGKFYLTSSNLAKRLLYFSDDFQLTRLQLIQVYWHFVDFLWIFLFFMFLFTF